MVRLAQCRAPIRRKLLVAFLLPLLPLLALHLIAIVRWSAVRQQTVLQSHADAAVAVSLALREFASDLRRAAEALPVRFGPAGRVAVSRAALRALLRSYRPLVTDVSVADASGRVAGSTVSGLVGRSVAEREYFRRLRDGEGWYLSDVLMSEAHGRPVVVFAAARRDEAGRLQGAVLFSIAPERLPDFVGLPRFGHRHVMLVDRRGVLVCSCPAEVWGERIGRPALDHPLVSGALRGAAPEPGVYVSPHDRGRYLGAVEIARGVGWVSVVSSPERAVMGPVRSHIVWTATWVVAAVATAVALAIVLSEALTRPVRVLAAAAKSLAEGDYSARAQVSSGDELAGLADAFNQMAERVEKHVAELGERHREIQELCQQMARLADEQEKAIASLERAKAAIEEAYQQERRITVALQEPLVPVIPMTIEGFDVGHLYQPASDEARVGGDFYDLVELRDGCILAMIGDVCGKGLAAASQATRTKYAFVRAALFEQRDPGRVLGRINQVLYEDSEEARMVTMFCVLVDPRRGELAWASAGHEPALLVKAATGEVIELLEPGYPLGVVWNAEYRTRTAPFGSGDVLVLYTDGVSEARVGMNFLRTEGVASVVREAVTLPAQEIARRVFEAAVEFAGGRLLDDAAIVVLRVGA